MFLNFRDAPIQVKLILMISLVAFMALLFVASAITSREFIVRKQQTEQQLASLADMIAWNSASALAFLDNKVADEALSALNTQPDIVAAYLYNNQQILFATYSARVQDSSMGVNQGISIRTSPVVENKTFFNAQFWLKIQSWLNLTGQAPPGNGNTLWYDPQGRLHLFHPVTIDKQIIGNLELVNDLRSFHVFLRNFYWITGLIALITLFLVFLISARLQRLFTSPLLGLMNAMQRVTQHKDYSQRVTRNSNDEFGQLVDVYNDMLNEIEQRDQLLAGHREELAMQVAQRTAELSEKNAALEQAIALTLVAKEEAEAANKAKSQFLANMSHEIRTPMNAVLGMIDFLRESNLNEDQQHYIEIVQHSSRLLLAVINDILDFSKIESGRMELDCAVFDICQVVQDGFAIFKNQAKTKGLDYRLEMETTSLFVEGDAVRLGQILMNLLNNAIKFTTQGSVILRVKDQTTDTGNIRLNCEVIDTGIGICLEKQHLIFEAFSQADNSMTRLFGGTGLGLAIARQLTQMMQGKIGVDSQPGSGATFWFWVELKPSTNIQPAFIFKNNCQFNARILVVEDYPSNQLLAKRLLEYFGCTVWLGNNGKEAVEILKQQQFDLILMDCQMPVMDGYQATQIIRQKQFMAHQGRHLPIIALTAHALVSDKSKCLSAGMDDWLTKPFTRQQLNEILQKWLPSVLIQSEIVPSNLSATNNSTLIQEDTVKSAIDLHFLAENFDFNNQDDRQFFYQLKQTFQESADQSLVKLEQSILESNAEQIRKLAHGLKSISANIGAMQLHFYCKELEQLAQANIWAEISRQFNVTQQEYQRVIAELDSLKVGRSVGDS